MAKDKTQFRCSACGCTTPKWLGQCPECQEWNTLQEQKVVPDSTKSNRFTSLAGTSPLVKLNQVEQDNYFRVSTGVSELDRVLGGGVVQGSVILCAGNPGIGKSTLLMQAMAGFHKLGHKCILVSGEESAGQVADRARRMGMGELPLLFQAEVQLEKIIATIEEQRPQFVIVDSIATMFTDQLTSAPGGVSQVKECLARLTRCAKTIGCGVLVIGHSTKTSDIAGPMAGLHIVDVVATLSAGDETSNYRMLRAIKNRFGSIEEVGIFHMQENGMKSVTNPSAMFLSTYASPVPGTCVFATVNGTRPMLVEVQALVDGNSPSPRRLSVGLERDRLNMLLAVLNRHGSMQTWGNDVYANVVGGIEATEPAVDLALAMAISSSVRAKALPSGLLVFGEVGLAGEIRPAAKGQQRLSEAENLGFTSALLPRANMPKKAIPGMTLYPVDRLDQALSIVRNLP